jgi:hypothetical protein
MKERRKRLLKSLFKKENPQHVTMTASNATNPGGGSKPGAHPTLTQAGQIDFEKEYELKEE